MGTCTFFGHRQCNGVDVQKLRNAMEVLIGKGVDTFYVGNQGEFDTLVRSTLKQLRLLYPHIRYAVVLAYLPTERKEYEDHADTMYPEGIEKGPPKFAIERRNRWLVNASDYCICYIHHTWGGAYKFVQLAKRKGKTVINIA